MHLRSISLKGFKSFPDRTRLDFTPGVSVIVGPNGSGKSNITDAVLWALGEQSPVAVRGQSMQDVIFAGAHGVQARVEAEVEIVLDNADGSVALPAGEISVTRKLTRAGDGEYRINGARCRLGDVIELMSDTGMGKEMHSVVSQGRVEGIVTSKPRDRRLLIEEAAGLGKHRKRRRRAQLKLERTQVNLDRALDVEREARTRLRPLKRQAEAAELHERLERQSDEARWALAREDLRAAGAARAEAERQVAAVRAAARQLETELAEVGARRDEAEQALASRGSEREGIANRFYAARSAGERIGLRQESARQSAATLAARSARRRDVLAALEAEAAADTGDDGAAERIAALETELAQLAEDRKVRLERELAELETRRAAAAEELERRAGVAAEAGEGRSRADAAADAARRARRAVESEAEATRREAARIGSELAKLNQFLRSHAGAPGGATALADALSAATGYELALAAALGPRLRAAVAADLGAAAALLDRAGRDGAAALVAPEGAPAPTTAPAHGAQRLLDHVRVDGEDAARALGEALLADVWVVEDPSAVAPAFAGTAVTRDGRVWSPRERELRQVPPGGEDRVLAERNRR
ncbi:MAG TPA: AAA family ATPase, partial [Solirubrobacteraceae bacterium]|nr:AAA family ATPase [Solirubrobacteraceae bacterium]